MGDDRATPLIRGISLATALTLGACSGNAATSVPSVSAPGVARGMGLLAHATLRRAVTQPTCTTSGTDSFVGKNNVNDAGGIQSVVVGGDNDDACAGNSAILGGEANGIDINSLFATIAGGSNNVAVSSGWGTISGGQINVITGAGFGYDTIGGGYENAVSTDFGTIAGGSSNTVGGRYGFAGGGQGNKVPGAWGAVGGGYGNQAAEVATVPGGKNNVATGEGSFAAGVGSTAAYGGDFVWSDFATGATALKGTAANQFLARASGGVTFYSSANLKSGVKLAAGSGTWASLSDRNAKSAIVPVSDDDLLAKVAALPISEWSYTTERGVRHVGPMAQDFYAAFKVGEDDRHITSIDEDGVALAAIKALDEKVAAKDAAIRSLQAQLTALASEVHAMRATRR